MLIAVLMLCTSKDGLTLCEGFQDMWQKTIYRHSLFEQGMLMSIPQNIVLQSQPRSVNDGIYDFDGVFLEIPTKNCIVGMLLTCCIVC